jgi:diguanylate cyclase (GGDEF)-like protein
VSLPRALFVLIAVGAALVVATLTYRERVAVLGELERTWTVMDSVDRQQGLAQEAALLWTLSVSASAPAPDDSWSAQLDERVATMRAEIERPGEASGSEGGETVDASRRFLDVLAATPDAAAINTVAEALEQVADATAADTAQMETRIAQLEEESRRQFLVVLLAVGLGSLVLVGWASGSRAHARVVRERARRAAALIEAMPIAALAVRDGRIMQANAAAEVLVGQRRTRIVGQAYTDVVRTVPLSDLRTDLVVVRTGADGTEEQRIVECRRADGALDERTDVVALWDVTRERDLEGAAQLAHLRQRAVVTSFPSGVVVIEPTGRVADANLAAAQLLGFAGPDQVRGTAASAAFGALVPEREVGDGPREPGVLPWVAVTGAGTSRASERFRIDGPHGPRWVVVQATMTSPSREARFVVCSVSDVSAERRTIGQLVDRAERDGLTGLLNRAGLDRWQREHRIGSVLYCDLDGFKAVNDTLGHQAGDEVLVAVAGRGQALVRDSDAFARLGGDEFVVVLGADGDPHAVAARMEEALGHPFPTSLGAAVIGVSVGITIPEPGEDLTAMMRRADALMYERKRSRKMQGGAGGSALAEGPSQAR